jgi:hypothetical protein
MTAAALLHPKSPCPFDGSRLTLCASEEPSLPCRIRKDRNGIQRP